MDIRFSKKFTKMYGKLPEKGKRKGVKVRSIDASPDLRILFTETDKYTLVIMVEVGSHSQLYG